MALTRTIDTDIQVALHLHPYHLNCLFRTSRTHAALAHNEFFWSLKTSKDYGMKLTYNKKEETWRQRYIHLTTIGSPYKAVRLGLVYCLEHLAARKRLLGPRAITMSVGKADILKWLSKHGPEVYVDKKTFGEFLPRCSYRLFKVIYKGSPDPLLYTYYAIKSENLELLKWFVEQGHPINEDLLWWACRYGNNEIIEWLQTQLS